MIARVLSVFIIIAELIAPACAQERVTVGTLRSVGDGALFLSDGRGYFKAEGLDVEMTAYATDQEVAEALAADATDLGLIAFTPMAFNLGGSGAIKAIAGQAREKQAYEGNDIIASDAAYAKGLRKLDDLSNRSVAITQLGSVFHYELGQIALSKHFDFASITLKPMQSLDAVAAAVAKSDVDAAILPVQYARELITASQAKLLGWYSELDEQQLGALFASTKAIETRRAMVEKFVRAYRHGAADFAAAFLRHDRYGKRISDAASQAAAAMIARYVYPGHAVSGSASTVEASVYFIDPQARLDPADIARQVDWYKSQGLIDPSVDARNVMDLSFIR